MDKKEIGFVGLGKMGQKMVPSLISKGYTVAAYDISRESVDKIKNAGAIPAYSIQDMVQSLHRRKVILIMVPAGKPADDVVSELFSLLSSGDIVIDGGNSYFEDSIRRYNLLKSKGINFLDVGVSGGVDGAMNGACMMVGGDRHIFDEVEFLFKDLCVKDGYGYIGKNGAGHFIKMVHNGIEYGMMAALSEGMQAIDQYKEKFDFDVKEIVKVYSHGSIIEGKLVNYLGSALKDSGFESISGEVPKGETEDEMEKLEKLSEMLILRQARMTRVATRKNPSYSGKITAALRNQFGGHKVIKDD